MPAYNPPPQILFSPISNHYQGKALRADTALREKQGEALQMEIDSAPAAAAAAARKEQRDINKEERLQAKADIEAQKFADEGHAKEVIDIGKGFTAYTAAIEKDPSLRKEAFALLNEHLTEVAGPEKAQAFIKKFDRNNNGFYEPNEEALIRAAGFASEKVKMAAPNPKDFTPASWAEYSKSGDSSKLRAIPKEPLVSINNAGETSATKAYGATVGKRAGDRDDKAFATYADDANLNRLELALANGARSGFGESFILDVRGALDTLGMAQFPEGAEQSEIVRSIGNTLALRMRNPDSGLGLTGNTSNKDLTFLKDSVAGIGRSEGGNRMLVKMAKKLNEFKRDIAAEQARIIAVNGGELPLDLDSQLMGFANGYEMFTKSERKEIASFANDEVNKPATVEDASDEDILNTLGLTP